eukprot:5942879-Prymnesium_polylepis.2
MSTGRSLPSSLSCGERTNVTTVEPRSERIVLISAISSCSEPMPHSAAANDAASTPRGTWCRSSR